MIGRSLRKLATIVAIALALGMLAAPADARIGGGMSFGSRGVRTFSPPPVTRTAPTTAAPITRSLTQPSAPGGFGARPGFFNRGGLFGGLAAGFLGAGLLGLLFGYGLFGGLGGFASVLGLLLQLALVAMIGRFLWTMWQRREPAREPAYAGGAMPRSASGSAGFGGMGSAPVEITPADYNTFERLLGEIQAAYSAEDLAALRARVTPEMLSYFSEQLAHSASRGIVNRISDVKLLQGDLAEAWREGSVEYASLAMRFALVDRTLERASGRLVDGSDSPQQVTELWTFLRAGQGSWLLSAIQQV